MRPWCGLDQNSGGRHSATWSWNDGCGSPDDVLKAKAGRAVHANHTFCKTGDFRVTLTVKDSGRRSTTVGRTVAVYPYRPVAAAVAGSAPAGRPSIPDPRKIGR
ncbi:MAG TPA: PKD domain-containing protein [Telluria sp.]|nr:PKD domain-containing protein [Telluria sp.]